MTNEERLTNEQAWRQRITEWEASGLSQGEFCRSRDIAVSAFQYWTKRLKKRAEPAQSDPVKLARVVTGAAVRSRAMVVRIGRVTIDIEAGFDRTTLREVIDVLAEREVRS